MESVFKGGSKAKVYAALVTNMGFNTTKHHNDMWNFIKARNVYIKPDRYKRNNVVSPGILIKVHPSLEWKKDLLQEIQYQLSKCDIPKTEDCDAWIKENHLNHKQEDKTPMPDFHFTMADAKWGDGHGKRWSLSKITDVACMGKHKTTRTICPCQSLAPHV
eukprot:8541847-Ditylum_brightwellii.AAC.1